MATTALVFIGHTKERIIESIRGLRPFSIDKIILIVGEQESNGEQIARGIAEELTLDLKAFFDVETRRIDKKNILRAGQQIIKIIRKEQAPDRDVVLNMSASLRTFSIAAYIAGCITQSKMITAIPEYDENDNEIGIEDIIDLPILPLNTLKDEQLKILATLRKGTKLKAAPSELHDIVYSGLMFENVPSRSDVTGIFGGVDSLDDLVNLLNPKLKRGTKAFATERSRLSHHLKNFESMGLVTKEKSGKNVMIRLTGLGEMFL